MYLKFDPPPKSAYTPAYIIQEVTRRLTSMPIPAVETPMHRWHVDGDTLYQHCLATGADELFQQFETKITRIRASGGHCIVHTSNIGNRTLWK